MFEICKHDVIFSWSRIQVFKFQTWHWVTQLAREILWGSLTSCPTHTSPFVTVYGAESFKSLVTLLNISIFYLWLLTFAGKNKLKVELCVRLQLSSSLHPKPPILVKPELCKRILLKMKLQSQYLVNLEGLTFLVLAVASRRLPSVEGWAPERATLRTLHGSTAHSPPSIASCSARQRNGSCCLRNRSLWQEVPLKYDWLLTQAYQEILKCKW